MTPENIPDSYIKDEEEARKMAEAENIKRDKEKESDILKSLEINKENILKGNSLEVIEELGWAGYREILKTISYADIIEKQIKQIEKIETEMKMNEKTVSELKTMYKNYPYVEHKISPEFIRISNQRAYEKVIELCGAISSKYKYEMGEQNGFFAHKHADKKFNIEGWTKKSNENGNLLDNKLTRIYFTVLTRQAPEIFESLFYSLRNKGVMSGPIILTLNLESYQGESLDRSFETNTIIIYAYGKDDKFMTGIMEAIKDAKNKNPELWKLSSSDLIKNKKFTIQDFEIPLDDTTAFVEMRNRESYHVLEHRMLVEEITGLPMPSNYYKKTTLDNLLTKFKQWSPKNPCIIPGTSRYKYMPGLILD